LLKISTSAVAYSEVDLLPMHERHRRQTTDRWICDDI